MVAVASTPYFAEDANNVGSNTSGVRCREQSTPVMRSVGFCPCHSLRNLLRSFPLLSLLFFSFLFLVCFVLFLLWMCFFFFQFVSFDVYFCVFRLPFLLLTKRFRFVHLWSVFLVTTVASLENRFMCDDQSSQMF